MTKPPKPLTPKQERFAQVVASGKSQAEAYRTAYDVSPDTKPETVWSKSSELMSDGRVSSRVAVLKEQLSAKVLWTKEQSVKILAQIAQEEETARDKIAAIKELNAMHGHNAPTKVEADVTLRNVEKPDRDIIGSIFNKLNKG